MEQTKYDVAKNIAVTNQQALVQKTLPAPKGRRRFDVPGGKTMFDPLQGSIHTKEDFTNALYTWLRHTRFFNEVRVSFSKDPSAMKTKATKVLDFDATADGTPIWQSHPGRKMYLASAIADVVYNHKNVVAIDVTKNNITVLTSDSKFDPSSPTWGPYLEFLPNYKAKGEYAIHRG